MNKKEKEITKKVFQAICNNHTGKMKGMWSLSTYCGANKHCQNRHKCGNSICSECFAFAMTESKRGEALKNKLIRNTELLTTEVIPVDDMPLLNVAFFRLESFGDLNNEIQAENYFNLCKRNLHTVFALWTKNPFIIRNAMKKKGVRKPKNLIIVYSSPIQNKPVDINVIKTVFPFVDKVFTVYTEEYINEHDVKINCGGNHCLSCLRCYRKNGETIINEKKK